MIEQARRRSRATPSWSSTTRSRTRRASPTSSADAVRQGRQGRPRVGQPEGDRLLVARSRRSTSSTKVVYLPFQLASQAQLFAQQLKAQGKTAVVFGSDGTFDSSKFNVNGSYISFFAPDVTTIPADASIVAAFHKQFPGATSPFGAPNYVLAQMYADGRSRRRARTARSPAPSSARTSQGDVAIDDPRRRRCGSPRTATSPARSSTSSRSQTASTRPSRSSIEGVRSRLRPRPLLLCAR